MNDLHMFRAARDASFSATYSGANTARTKIGCVITYKGTILARGCNSDKTHPRQAIFNVHRFKQNEICHFPAKVHGEIAALNKIKHLDIDFNKIHIYVYRELSDGRLGIARPCAACMAAIKEMGIRHIHYTTYDGYCHEVINKETTNNV